MEIDIFISYSSKNKNTAYAICHALEQANIRCWIAPRDIDQVGGQSYASEITKAIINSKAVILVFSCHSATSYWVASEINIAFSNGKPIIPYKIDNTDLRDSSELYLMLNSKHWIESYPNAEQKFAVLINSALSFINGNENVANIDKEKISPTNKNKRNIGITILCLLAVISFAYYLSQSKFTNNRETGEETIEIIDNKEPIKKDKDWSGHWVHSAEKGYTYGGTAIVYETEINLNTTDYKNYTGNLEINGWQCGYRCDITAYATDNILRIQISKSEDTIGFYDFTDGDPLVVLKRQPDNSVIGEWFRDMSDGTIVDNNGVFYKK